ncbi:MAG TPA: glycosyltransferase family 2 protein [Candidatus Tectomicrobia bacterium]|nr:glycosyltransferase family 2 protein [Candidatus Tectomicrobia bacterium]
MAVPLSVLIPTRNEEQNIRKCLESVAWADEIYVVDSCSADHTTAIARSLGAEVVNFTWDGRGPRKLNWCLNNIGFRNEWLLVVDADEEPSAALREEIAARVLPGKEPYAAYLIPYYYYFLGQLLKHGDPLRKLVLMKHSLARYEDREIPGMTTYDLEMHCHPIVAGKVGRLTSRMIHRDFDDLHHHFSRHNVYSDWEALLRTRYRHRNLDGEIHPHLFGSAMERRRFLKRLFLTLPGKPWLYFFYSYLLRGGFLDGRPGFIYSGLKAFYWYQISIKEYEIRQREKSGRCVVGVGEEGGLS